MRNLLDFLKTYHHWFIFIFLEIASGVLLFQYTMAACGFRHRMPL